LFIWYRAVITLDVAIVVSSFKGALVKNCVAARIGVGLRFDPYAVVYALPLADCQKLNHIVGVDEEVSAVTDISWVVNPTTVLATEKLNTWSIYLILVEAEALQHR
jgi:hypothetical protein